MLKVGSVFVGDYAITGGLFICAQLLVLIWAYPNSTITELWTFSESLSDQLNDLPSPVQPAFTSLLVALTLLSVFFFGFLFDIIGSLLAGWETGIFAIHIKRNRTWVTNLVDSKFKEYASKDLPNVLSAYPRRRVVHGFIIWKPSTWKKVHKVFKPLLASGTAFRRMEQLFISYAFDTEREARVTWLQEKIRLSRISNAITIVFFFVSLEIVSISPIYGRSHYITGAMPSLLTLLAVLITVRAYSRFCTALFATIYTQMRSEQERQKESVVQEKVT
jgi:hypothetical protein